MTTVEDLMSPATVDLDEEGLALYAAMRDAEDEVTALLMASSAVIYQCGETLERSDQARGARRKLAVVPPSALRKVHAQWPGMLDSLRPSRVDFQRYLNEHKDERTSGAGARSTALPVWIGHADDLSDVQVAERLRYHHSQAYRAGKLTSAEVRLIVEKKLMDTQGLILNASKARQPGRVSDYAARLKKIEKELVALKSVDGQFLARVLSGQGLRLTAKWPGNPTSEFGVPVLTLIAATGLPELAPARRDRISKYGEPLLELEECRLMLFRVVEPTTRV